MSTMQVVLLSVCTLVFLGMGLLIYIGNHYSLNRIKNKRVGDGQYGTARFANKSEISRTYKKLDYLPQVWREGKDRPELQGLIVGCEDKPGGTTALLDDGDIHTLMIGASGVGKTAYFLYPNIEYACACGMSFLVTDTKGDVYRHTATVAAKYYGYDIAVIDLRNPTRSDGYNMLYLVNKYMDLYAEHGELQYKAKAEKFAKITGKTIISAGMDVSNMGQNAYFYESAEGIITAAILLVAEFCEPSKRHIISVFKLIQDLLTPSNIKGKNQFQLLIQKLPPEHKARWFAGAALNTAEQAMASVLSTALSRLNAFLDSELEQILCFDTSIDVERFCRQKTAVYLVLPEEDATKHFLVSLIFQQVYREMLTVADEHGGQLPNRAMIYADEIGTIPKIESMEMIFSASRSRKISIVAIIQSLAQFEATYGKEGAEIIADNCQCTLFGGFAPNSRTAEVMSNNLGKQTVMSGSVTMGGKSEPSQSLQMMERPLMTVDELKSMPRGHFVVMKTGCNPMRSKLKLFFKWGIQFEEDYLIPERAARQVSYADKDEVEMAIIKKFMPKPPQDTDKEPEPEEKKILKQMPPVLSKPPERPNKANVRTD